MKSPAHIRSKNRKTRILIVDDHPIVREGLRLLIGSQPDFEIVAEAENGHQALELLPALRPEIVVMDLTMPRLNGLDLATQLKQDRPRIRVVILTVHENEAYLQELVNAGVAGYVLKRSAGNELLQALRIVAAGGVYFDRRLAEKSLIQQMDPDRSIGNGRKTRPSPREEKVLRLLAWGYTNKEVAGDLGVSTKSVETYRTRICKKLDLNGRTDIVRYALHQGWLKEE